MSETKPPSVALRIAEALERIATVLETPRPQKKSWASIYGQALRFLKPGEIGRDFETTLEAHSLMMNVLHREFGDSPSTFQITSMYTPLLLENAIAEHLLHYRSDLSANRRQLIAMHIVSAVEAAGLWET